LLFVTDEMPHAADIEALWRLERASPKS